MLYRDILTYQTKPNGRHQITDDVNRIIAKYGLQEGLCNVFLKGTTAGLMLNEDDKMLMADLEKMLVQLAPPEKMYHHPENAASHLKSMLFSNNLSIPIANGKLLMGTWQTILLWEFDVKTRERLIVVTMLGA